MECVPRAWCAGAEPRLLFGGTRAACTAPIASHISDDVTLFTFSSGTEPHRIDVAPGMYLTGIIIT